MGRTSRARRIARAAAYGGSGLGAVGVLATGLLFAEAKLARGAIKVPEGPTPSCDGRYGARYPGEPVVLAVLGDSTAAGMGAELPVQTPGALFADGLADVLRRPVEVHGFGVVGAQSSDLYPQVERALEISPELVVILIGGNDVTHLVRPPVSARHLDRVVRQLREAGAEVVVGTCPDLGTIQPIGQPLRWMCRRWSREIATAQTVVTVRAGGRTVSLGDLLGPAFAAAPDEMFCSDRFHPSPAGYAKAVEAILPALAAAMGVPEDRPAAELATDPVRALPKAAVAAADVAGTEVSGPAAAPVLAPATGTRWVRLRQRLEKLVARPLRAGTAGRMQPGALGPVQPETLGAASDVLGATGEA